MTGNQRPVVVIACKVFQDLLERFLPTGLADRVTFLDYGLHENPKKLTKALQEQIDSIQKPSLILLGYGLCGNGLNGIQAGQHTLVVPRADDCIAIFLGSYQAYLKEFNDNPGTYYLTKGWLESGSDPLKEYHQMIEKYGVKTGEWIMDQQYMHYSRLVLVAHTQEDLETYRPMAKEVAEYCQRWDMEYEEVLGSDVYIRNLVAAASELKDSNEEFLVINPGGVIQQSQFIRIPA
jgi:hypothetical protein